MEEKGEFPSERLMLVTATGGKHSAYGHIIVRVIRRAMSHKTNAEGIIVRYYDDRNATGYRNATWSNGTQRAIYVRDLLLNGQFNIQGALPSDTPGTLYGSNLEFDAYRVDSKNVHHIASTLRAWDRFRESVPRPVFHDNPRGEMLEKIALLQGFLGISKFVVVPEHRRDSSGHNLAVEQDHIELNNIGELDSWIKFEIEHRLGK